jgi:chitodextrinase
MANPVAAQTRPATATEPAPHRTTTPPSTPSNLQTTGVTTSQVTLSWQPSTDNVGVSVYLVYRDGVLSASTAGTSLTTSGLNSNTMYTFTVAAIDTSGNTSAQSAPHSVTTAASSGAAYGTHLDTNDNPLSENQAWHRANNV